MVHNSTLGSFRLQWTRTSGRSRDPGGMSHWGLYIIRVNHSLKGTLNDDEATILTALWTRHRECAPGPHQGITPKFPTLSADRRRTCSGDLWIWYPFLHYFLFSIRALRTVTHRVVKRYPFYAFLFTRMMYRPQWDMPPRESRECLPATQGLLRMLRVLNVRQHAHIPNLELQNRPVSRCPQTGDAVDST